MFFVYICEKSSRTLSFLRRMFSFVASGACRGNQALLAGNGESHIGENIILVSQQRAACQPFPL